MFINLFNHLLTIVGMTALVAIATIIIAFIVSVAYIFVKSCIVSSRKPFNKENSDGTHDA